MHMGLTPPTNDTVKEASTGCQDHSLLKSNGPNSISKDALRDEDCPWLINCTTQEYLVNVGQDSHFNMPPHVWQTNQTRGP
jgi:hypothetical protein